MASSELVRLGQIRSSESSEGAANYFIWIAPINVILRQPSKARCASRAWQIPYLSMQISNEHGVRFNLGRMDRFISMIILVAKSGR